MVLYSALLLLALVAGSPWWLWKMVSSGHYRTGLSGRLGWLPSGLDEVRRQRESREGLVWLHAVSVGEVLAAERLVAELATALPQWQIVVSTTTATGQQMAQNRLGVPTFYLPLDFAFLVRRYLRALRPTLFVTVESELWPRMLVECERAGVPVAVVNARISDRSLPRYLRLRRWWKPLFDKVAIFCAQGQESADRLIAIGAGADRVRVTGNLKYDAPAGGDNPMVRQVARLLFKTRLIVAGSTLAGEESLLLAQWAALLERVPDAVLLIAPRHPQRFGEVHDLIESSGFPFVRCSQLSPATQTLAPGTILLLDTLGDLAPMYGLAGVAFIGGSLVRKGGHNPLEATRFGIPVLMGPSFENFREMVEPLVAQGDIRIVESSGICGALADAIQPHGRARTPAAVQTGATARTVAALLQVIVQATGGQTTQNQAADGNATGLQTNGLQTTGVPTTGAHV